MLSNMIRKAKINNIIGKFGVELHGKSYLQALAKGEFKNDTFEIQKALIKQQAPVIFDIGANTGSITAKYLKYFPNCDVYSFEPFPDSYRHLESRFTNFGNVHCSQKAVASTVGSKIFYVNKNADTNSLLRPQKTGLRSDEQVANMTAINVESIVLDEFCVVENIKHIDILKMDIQGGEYDALVGLDAMLSNNSIDLIYSEVYFIQQYENQPLFHDISQLLFKYDFYLQDIYNPIYGNGHLAWADVIFTRMKS